MITRLGDIRITAVSSFLATLVVTAALSGCGGAVDSVAATDTAQNAA